MSKFVTTKCDRCNKIVEPDETAGAIRLVSDHTYVADLCAGCSQQMLTQLDWVKKGVRKKPVKKAATVA